MASAGEGAPHRLRPLYVGWKTQHGWPQLIGKSFLAFKPLPKTSEALASCKAPLGRARAFHVVRVLKPALYTHLQYTCSSDRWCLSSHCGRVAAFGCRIVDLTPIGGQVALRARLIRRSACVLTWHSPAGRDHRFRARPATSGPPVCPSMDSSGPRLSGMLPSFQPSVAHRIRPPPAAPFRRHPGQSRSQHIHPSPILSIASISNLLNRPLPFVPRCPLVQTA